MPSPIATGGFQVSAQPGIQYLDPRLLTPNYGGILPAVQQGAAAVGQFQQIQDEARMRPLRAALAQLQIQQQQEQLARAPLQRQLQLAQISEAEQNAATPRIITGDTTLRDAELQPEDYPAFDENGVRSAPLPTPDLLQITDEQLVGPNGVITPRQVTKVLKTGEQRDTEAAQRAAQLEATKALSTQRSKGKDFESTTLIELYNNAVEDGDNEAAGLYKARLDRINAAPGLIPAGVSYDRRVEQLAADAGITLARAQALSKTPEGAALLAKAAVANKAASKSAFGAPVMTAAELATLAGGAPQATVPSLDQRTTDLLTTGAKTVAEPVVTIPTPKSKAERDALPDGTQYIGPDGLTYTKGKKKG